MHEPVINHLAATDPEIAGLVQAEAERQFSKIRLMKIGRQVPHGTPTGLS